MSKAAEQNKIEKPVENVTEPKTGEGGETSVPYQRFKNVIDQKNELEQQIAAYRERYGEISNSQNRQPAEQNQLQFNEQVIKQLEDAISQRAMQISGLSKEDVELQRMQALQNQSVNAYNEYFAQKQATSNFDAVKQ